jgi:hypothetical protein
MESCCTVKPAGVEAATACSECHRVGRSVERITLKALLRSESLMRLADAAYRFCPTATCGVAYFAPESVFRREDVVVPVFQKEPEGGRTVCYCFAITEFDLRREIVERGTSTAADRITALVKADRCACEVRNPQGTCCLGNVTAVVKALAEAPATA